MNELNPRAFAAPDLYRFTAGQVMALTEAGFLPEKRIELIDGVLYEMAAQMGLHARAVMELVHFLIGNSGGAYRVWPQVSMFFAGDLILEPDLSVTRGVIDTENAQGADFALIVEIAVTSQHHDLHRKAPLYAAQGVAHYWVVDVPGRRLHRHEAPSGSRYGSVSEQGFDAPLFLPYAPDIAVDLDTLISLDAA